MIRLAQRRGATKVEYALMLMLVSVTCILVLNTIGQSVAGIFGRPFASTSAQADPASDDGDEDEPLAKKGRRRGNPGNGNNGNDKPVGNAPAGR